MLPDHYLLSIEVLKERIANADKYPFTMPAIRQLEKLEFNNKVTFLIGENGSGKSTLLEAIATAYGFNPEGGSKNFTFSTKQSHSLLGECLRLAKGYKHPKDGYFLRAESFYNLATNLEVLEEDIPGLLQSYGDKSLHQQSHGESFLSLFQHRFFGHGLYILDEPEAALSPIRQMSLLIRMQELVHEHSQFIIATHSPIVLAYPDATILELSDKGITEVSYKETSIYSTYKAFLDNPKAMLRELEVG